jgi:hypothetical protein
MNLFVAFLFACFLSGLWLANGRSHLRPWVVLSMSLLLSFAYFFFFNQW